VAFGWEMLQQPGSTTLSFFLATFGIHALSEC
jgi:hypothetical protein